MGDDGIRYLFGKPPEIEGAPEAQGKSYSCYPHWPIVDTESRLVSCKRCEKQLDPVDVLLEVAHKHQEWVRLSEECKSLRKQIGALKEEEQRVRARTRSHSRKDADVAVQAERERQLERLHDIVTSTREITSAVERIERVLGLRRRH